MCVEFVSISRRKCRGVGSRGAPGISFSVSSFGSFYGLVSLSVDTTQQEWITGSFKALVVVVPITSGRKISLNPSHEMKKLSPWLDG